MTTIEEHMARTRQGQGETLSGSPIAQFTNFAQKPIQSLRAPTTADTGYEIGQEWVDTSTCTIFGLAKVAGGSATWTVLSVFDGDEIIEFTESPIMQSSGTAGGIPSGSSDAINLMCLQQGIIMEQFIAGANQNIIAPRMSNDGLEVALDQVSGKGVEYNFGAERVANEHLFSIGDRPAFFEVEFAISDMSGAGPFIIGYRDRGVNQEDINDYPDYASIGMDAATSATNIVIVSKQFPDPQAFTDTTDLWGGDDNANKLRVLIDSEGSVTYTINGKAPTVTKSFKFPGAFRAVPFMRFTQSADLSLVNLRSMKVGVQC